MPFDKESKWYYHLYVFFNKIAECLFVCKDQSSGVHFCMECKNPVHAICGKNPDGLEGLVFLLFATYVKQGVKRV